MKMKHLAVAATSAAVCFAANASSQPRFEPTWASLEANYRVPEWYENAKFGIFCHWGVQCVPEAGDWYGRNLYNPGSGQGKFHRNYYGDPKEFGLKDLIPRWKAERWNPEELCALYKRMGARYVVAMANHHDNFDNWNSTHQPWNSVNMGPKRDIIGDWGKAVKAAGMHFGVSFHAVHAWTWFEPAQDYDGNLVAADGKGKWWEGYDPQQLYCQQHEPSRNFRNYGEIHKQWHWEVRTGVSIPSESYRKNIKDRVFELVDVYKPDLLYFDDTVLPFYNIDDTGLEIAAHFYNVNPNAVLNGKILNEAQRKAMVWDVERGTPPKPMSPHWQTDTCIGAWHYTRSIAERGGYKSAAEVLRMLADIVAKNGNLLLSVPIRPDGTIDPAERKICEDIAAWMAVNGEAIFDTVPWTTCGEGPQLANAPELSAQGFNEGRMPKPTEKDVRYTASKDGQTLYAIVLVPPAEGAAPEFAAAKAANFTVAERLAQVGSAPAVWRLRRDE